MDQIDYRKRAARVGPQPKRVPHKRGAKRAVVQPAQPAQPAQAKQGWAKDKATRARNVPIVKRVVRDQQGPQVTGRRAVGQLPDGKRTLAELLGLKRSPPVQAPPPPPPVAHKPATPRSAIPVPPPPAPKAVEQVPPPPAKPAPQKAVDELFGPVNQEKPGVQDRKASGPAGSPRTDPPRRSEGGA
jgi:hypothetical protein